ncbi:MAG: hypothetical protein JNG84_00835, partial [Archangium sp.]|nr:hypothetical protein [Archangium sp.]
TLTCVECLSNLDCPCPRAVCNAEHTCEAPGPGGLPVPDPGESCGDAPALRTCSTSLQFSVDLAARGANETPSCGTANGRDAVYSLVIDDVTDVRVSVAPSAGSAAQPVVTLRRGCTGGATIACTDGLSGTATLRVKSLPRGHYGLIIDSYDATSAGPVDVVVELLPATQPANETCALPTDVPLDGTPVAVDLRAADDDAQVSCNGLPDSPEVFYAFTLSAEADLSVVASPSKPDGTDTVLALRPASCGATETLSCADFVTASSERLRARRLAAGSYQLVVEAKGRSAAGIVNVAATVTSPPASPPSNDTCDEPRAIIFPPGQSSVTLTPFDTFAANDDLEVSCNSEPDSPDVVYSFTLGAQQQVTILTSRSGDSTGDPVVALRSTACDTGSVELDCADVAPGFEEAITKRLEPGTYFIVVEAYGRAGAGLTTLTVSLSP